MARYYIGISKRKNFAEIYSLVEEKAGESNKSVFKQIENVHDIEKIANITARHLWEDRNPIKGYEDMDMVVTGFGTLMFYGKARQGGQNIEIFRFTELQKEEKEVFESALEAKLYEYMGKTPSAVKRVADQ